ncbi:MAG: hypothetical protein R3B82_10840 [Sandaracinaceae bacterium]
MKTASILIAVSLLVGAPLLALGGYLALSEAREVQAAFANAETRTGTVVHTVTQRVEYVDGTGEYGERRSAEVHLVEVQLPGETYPEQITTLVTAGDVERLHEGDEVELAYLSGGHPVQPLNARSRPNQVHYVLRSSLENGPMELFGWARGRHWGAAANILIGIGGVILLFPFLVLFAVFNQRRRASQAAPVAG